MKAVDLGDFDYDGSQLHHAFVYEQSKVLGSSIGYFRGAANVREHLVDLKDLLASDYIFSDDMWHFIIEIPDATITEMVVWQRLFISMCTDELRPFPETIIRDGDDIMVDDVKLSVSIATLSQFSGLIHVGINVTVGENCPVDAIGLEDFTRTKYCNTFGERMAKLFVNEYLDVKNATYKVIGV